MADVLVVHKGRKNVVDVDLGIDITGDVITSEIRAQPKRDSTLIATWTVAVIQANAGILTLTLDDTETTDIVQDRGYMDIKRVTGTDPVPLFERPLEIEFRDTVTV